MKNLNLDNKRRRRRKRKIQIIMAYVLVAIGLAWFFESQATTTIIFVRHAEESSLNEEKSSLTKEGEIRSAELARQLVDADVIAGVDAIYSTSFQYSKQTALPISKALNIPIEIYDISDTELIIEDIIKQHKGKIILVVGHNNTIPLMIGNMGASKDVPKIEDNEYDNIYLVSIPWFGKTKTIRLRYGVPYTS